jgi:hypothetical protein
VSDRFPAEVAAVRREAGWSPDGRPEVDAAAALEHVRGEVGRHGARIVAFPAATDVVHEFGGLYLMQDGPGLELCRSPFAIDPTQVAATAENLAHLGRMLNTKLPIGIDGDDERCPPSTKLVASLHSIMLECGTSARQSTPRSRRSSPARSHLASTRTATGNSVPSRTSAPSRWLLSSLRRQVKLASR